MRRSLPGWLSLWVAVSGPAIPTTAYRSMSVRSVISVRLLVRGMLISNFVGNPR